MKEVMEMAMQELAQIAAAETVDELRAMWPSASTVQQEQITARANQLTGEA